MAWNEPGGQKPRDPWGGGGGNNNQGPPDLDDVLKDLKDKLGGIFGGGSGGDGSRGGGKGGGAALIGILLAGLLVFYSFWALFQVDSAEQGVVLRFGKFDRIVEPGLNFHLPPFEEYHRINVTQVKSHQVSEEMLTADTNIVSVSLEVQYQVLDPVAYLLRVADSEAVLVNAAESALRHVVGGATIDGVLSARREEIRQLIHARLQEYLDRYGTGLLVATVALDRTEAPAAVRDAFQDVTRAREDEDRFQKEAQAYANSVIPEARGRAQRILEEAEAHRAEVVDRARGEAERFGKLLDEYRRAPEVTRERLYLETMETVLSQTSKVLVDVSDGNSLIYLPLDQIMKGHREQAPQQQQPQVEHSGTGNDGAARRTQQQSGSFYGTRSREVRQ